MTRLNKPIHKQITGPQTRGQDILIPGVAPLPIDDNAITPILYGVGISVDETCTVQITSGATVLYEKTFPAKGIDNVVDVIRKGHPTNGMEAHVTGCGGTNETRMVLDVGFEYNGGAKAVGG